MGNFKNNVKDRGGFTLIEVLAASVIFAVVAVPLVQMLWVGNRVGYQAGEKTAALNIAQQKMEELLAQGGVREEDAGFFETGRTGFSAEVSQFPWEELILVRVGVDYCMEGKECSTEICCILPRKD